MKKLITILLTLLSLGCSNKNNSQTTDSNNNREFKTHIDKINGFTIDYPTAWDTTKLDARITFMAFEHDADTTDEFNEGLNITVFPNEGLTIDEIVDKNIEMAKHNYENPEFKKTKSKNKNGLDFIMLKITLTTNGLTLISYSTFFDNGTSLYTLTMTMEARKKDKYSKILNVIVDSFNWIKN